MMITLAQSGTEEEDRQPLSSVIWNTQVSDNFKSPPLSAFDGKTDPTENITAFNTQVAIIRAVDPLKCKLLSGTLKEAALCWYIGLNRLSTTGYLDIS